MYKIPCVFSDITCLLIVSILESFLIRLSNFGNPSPSLNLSNFIMVQLTHWFTFVYSVHLEKSKRKCLLATSFNKYSVCPIYYLKYFLCLNLSFYYHNSKLETTVSPIQYFWILRPPERRIQNHVKHLSKMKGLAKIVNS